MSKLKRSLEWLRKNRALHRRKRDQASDVIAKNEKTARSLVSGLDGPTK